MALALVPASAGAQTTTFTTGAANSRNREYVALFVNVSAVSGTTPTLVVKLQESADGVNFVDIPTFASSSLTTTGTVRVATPATAQKAADYVRAVCTIGGTTPSFTFTVHVAVTDISME